MTANVRVGAVLAVLAGGAGGACGLEFIFRQKVPDHQTHFGLLTCVKQLAKRDFSQILQRFSQKS